VETNLPTNGDNSLTDPNKFKDGANGIANGSSVRNPKIFQPLSELILCIKGNLPTPTLDPCPFNAPLGTVMADTSFRNIPSLCCHRDWDIRCFTRVHGVYIPLSYRQEI